MKLRRTSVGDDTSVRHLLLLRIEPEDFPGCPNKDENKDASSNGDTAKKVVDHPPPMRSTVFLRISRQEISGVFA